MDITTNSPEETFELGFTLGEQLPLGSIICIEGEMGAGKTALSQGIIRGIGVKDKYITSPTYTIVNEYPIENYFVYHFDIYRVGDIDELYAIGFEEYFREDSIVLIEWADRIKEELPSKKIIINIKKGKDFNQRKLSIDGLENYEIHLGSRKRDGNENIIN